MFGRKMFIFRAYGTTKGLENGGVQLFTLTWLMCLLRTSLPYQPFSIDLLFLSFLFLFYLITNSFFCSSFSYTVLSPLMYHYLRKKFFLIASISTPQKIKIHVRKLFENLFFIVKVDNWEFYNSEEPEKQFLVGWVIKNLVQNTNILNIYCIWFSKKFIVELVFFPL